MKLGEAEELAMKTDYACFAVETKGNEINKADAGAFFLAGFEYAQKQRKLECPNCGEIVIPNGQYCPICHYDKI